MKYFAVIAGVAFLVSTSAHAEWGKTRWGMTLQQVEKVAPNTVPFAPAEIRANEFKVGDGTLARLPGFRIGDQTFDVRFASGPDGRLQAVNLFGDGDAYIPTLQALSVRYGQPVQQGGGALPSATFADKGTSIMLIRIMSTIVHYAPAATGL